ncbi:MAG TPA: vanadium-dependent haloperoxidase, partial [Longimicrobium sp.]|nr:vanadium-dependent haloperoxidase [Longimicrobium sp.]
KLTNPQGGLAFDAEGPDAQALTMVPAPRFDSDVTAHEMGELYWMALARDVHFSSYGSDATVAAAIASLNAEFPQFGGTRPVTAQNVFRGIYPGEQVGPYVSQFLLKGNIDQRKPDGQGRDANEGFISYGARTIDQRLYPAAANVDYLTTFSTWLDVQNGVDKRGQDSFEATKRFIRNLRDGATFVHFDQVIDAYYNAAWILTSEPSGNQLTFQSGTTGRPQIDLEFPKDEGNPYDQPGTAKDSPTQVGFGTFGPIHLFQVLSEVLGRAIRAVWYQKWGVHRRLRPEEYGGRVHNHITGARTYPLHSSIVTSLQGGGLSGYFGNAGEKFPTSYLLPQAYPEGAPTHPAYGAGHATGSGALVTILKAFFDESAPIENPVQADATGANLVAYTGADASQMTVGGELNKLAGNIAIFRNAAGVHWRSDYTESLPFGEAIAIGLLQEMSLGFNEDDAFFQITKFDGRTIRIFDGKVVPVD